MKILDDYTQREREKTVVDDELKISVSSFIRNNLVASLLLGMKSGMAQISLLTRVGDSLKRTQCIHNTSKLPSKLGQWLVHYQNGGLDGTEQTK